MVTIGYCHPLYVRMICRCRHVHVGVALLALPLAKYTLKMIIKFNRLCVNLR